MVSASDILCQWEMILVKDQSLWVDALDAYA